jgi:hypothetical protein
MGAEENIQSRILIKLVVHFPLVIEKLEDIVNRPQVLPAWGWGKKTIGVEHDIRKFNVKFVEHTHVAGKVKEVSPSDCRHNVCILTCILALQIVFSQYVKTWQHAAKAQTS